MQRSVWLGLSYTVPINPSKARVYVWRKLKDFGAEYLKQGVAILPESQQNMQQFSALSQKIRQMGGESCILELRFTDPADEAEMVARFKKQAETEYRDLVNECKAALRELRQPGRPVSPQENDRIRQMIKRYRKARARDYFSETGAASREIEEGINEIIDSVREVASDVGKQLRALLDN